MKKIYYILIAAFTARLYHITFPVIGWHSWRQSDTASIAKNFFENGFRLFYPQINWTGNSTSYVESEFQLYPLIVSVFYSVFGVNDMWGRLISVICSVITVYIFYLIVKRTINETAALWSAFIYALIPLNIYYGRTFMPESMMLMFSALGIYYFIRWYDNERLYELYLSAVFISLAILLKLPGFYLGLPLVYLAYNKYKYRFLLKPQLWLYSIIVFVPVVIWYYHAHQLYINGGTTFDIWNAGRSKWAMFELLIQPQLYNNIFLMSIAERHLTYPGFILFLWGIFIKRKFPLEKLFDFWFIAVIIYILIVPQGNFVHEYYQLPVIFPAAVYIAKVLTKYLSVKNGTLASYLGSLFSKNKLRVSIVLLSLILIPVLSFLRLQRTMNAESYSSPVFSIADAVKNNSQRNDLIITACDGNPVYLYICDRKGWVVVPQNIDSTYISERCRDGATLLTAEKRIFNNSGLTNKLNWLLKNYEVIKEDKDIVVMRVCLK